MMKISFAKIRGSKLHVWLGASDPPLLLDYHGITFEFIKPDMAHYVYRRIKI